MTGSLRHVHGALRSSALQRGALRGGALRGGALRFGAFRGRAFRFGAFRLRAFPGSAFRSSAFRPRLNAWRRLAVIAAVGAPLIALLPAAGPAVAAAGASSTGARLAAEAAPAAVPGPPSGWSTVFSDDFNGAAGSGPSSAWQYDTGPGSNFGTGEIETMTNSSSNVHLDGNGNLDITALNQGGSWTSGRIQTTSANVGAAAGRRTRGDRVHPAAHRRPRLLAGVLDARTRAMAGEWRDRHHGGRQRPLRAVRHRALRDRSRRPVQRAERHRQRAAVLLRLPDRVQHLLDDPQPHEHLG